MRRNAESVSRNFFFFFFENCFETQMRMRKVYKANENISSLLVHFVKLDSFG